MIIFTGYLAYVIRAAFIKTNKQKSVGQKSSMAVEIVASDAKDGLKNMDVLYEERHNSSTHFRRSGEYSDIFCNNSAV